MPDYNEIKEVEWAWLAGAIDGEGNLRVYERKKKHTYQAVLRIFNIDYSFVKKAADIIQGNILWKQGDTPLRTRTCYYTQISSTKRLYRVLQGVYPYLTAKQRLAYIVMKFLELRMKSHYYTGAEAEMVLWCEEAMKVNIEKGKVFNKKED
jgi:hypothetical protein